jgi:DnaJ-domain-containing protein 1
VTGAADPRRSAARGALLPVVYRLGREGASGVLTALPAGARPEVFVVRRGAVVCGDGEVARRHLVTRLARAAAEPQALAGFDADVAACPPGATSAVALDRWARGHLEAQLDAALGERLVAELTGARLALVAELAPVADGEADRRLVAALAEPRRLDEVWTAARAPRYRLLAFLHFLRGVGALRIDGRAGARASSPAPDARRLAALRVLGVASDGDVDAIKRAYRRLARALHPDLQPTADAARRRALERQFAEVAAAYDALQG